MSFQKKQKKKIMIFNSKVLILYLNEEKSIKRFILKLILEQQIKRKRKVYLSMKPRYFIKG